MVYVYLEVSELGEGINNDAEDDVEADGGEEDEECDLVERQVAEVCERVLGRMSTQHLYTQNHATTLGDSVFTPSRL